MSGTPQMPQLSPAELHEDQGPQLLPVFIIFTILPVIAVCLRLLARKTTRVSLWWDDYLILVALAWIIIQLAFLVEALNYGLGQHVGAIPLTIVGEYVERYLLYTFLSELFYATAITLIKCSILCLYLRIFNINRTFRKVCYGLLGFVLAWGLAITLVTIFQCTPVQAAWDKLIQPQQCFDLEHFVIGTNVPNIIADAAVIILPIPLVWKLQLSVMRKVGIVVVFLLAGITTIISIVRVTLNAHIDVSDPTWNFVKVAVLSTVEVSVGVTCACMPVIYPLLRICVGRKVKSTTQGSSTMKPGYGMKISRPRQKFSQLEEGGDTKQMWKNKVGNSGSDSSGQDREVYDEIPMGSIHVTRDIEVEHTERFAGRAL